MDFPELNKSTHTYMLNGYRVPGVTTVLKPIIDYSGIDPDTLQDKAELGTHVHLATEFVDKGGLDYDNLDERLKGYVKAWMQFRFDTGIQIELTEHVVYHSRYKYAGTLDRVAILNGDRCVIDIKCTVALTPSVGVQLAAYMEAENSIRKSKNKVVKRFAVQLKPNGTYRLCPYTDTTDFKMFTSLLTLYNWRLKNDKCFSY